MEKLMVEADKKHYIADAAIIWCYDNRFWKSFQYFLESERIKNFDPIIVAGGTKSIASPESESERKFMMKQIELSIKLHHTPRVVLMNHSDCGGYGGLKTFNNDEHQEFSAHKEELQRAKRLVEKDFPNIRVDTVFVNFEGIKFI